jgi:adenylate kinase family enzyme
MADCASRGWVLEGFPQTRAQAVLMAKKSLLPSNVIMVNIPLEEVYRRTEPFVREEFSCDRTILKRRLDYACKHAPQMVYFFQKFYNNVTSIDGLNEDVTVRSISDNL